MRRVGSVRIVLLNAEVVARRARRLGQDELRLFRYSLKLGLHIRRGGLRGLRADAQDCGGPYAP